MEGILHVFSIILSGVFCDIASSFFLLRFLFSAINKSGVHLEIFQLSLFLKMTAPSLLTSTSTEVVACLLDMVRMQLLTVDVTGDSPAQLSRI